MTKNPLLPLDFTFTPHPSSRSLAPHIHKHNIPGEKRKISLMKKKAFMVLDTNPPYFHVSTYTAAAVAGSSSSRSVVGGKGLISIYSYT
jgi:hypothetical protein